MTYRVLHRHIILDKVSGISIFAMFHFILHLALPFLISHGTYYYGHRWSAAKTLQPR